MKDSNNKVDYNVWSCGEYEDNTQGYDTNCIVQTSKEYSLIGENSLKVINDTSNTKSAYTSAIAVASNKTYNLSCILYNPESQVNVVLISNKETFSVVVVPPSDSPQRINVSYSTTDDSTLTCRWNIFSNYCFIDDVSLTGS